MRQKARGFMLLKMKKGCGANEARLHVEGEKYL